MHFVVAKVIVGTMRPHISPKSSKVKFVKALKIVNVVFMVLGTSHAPTF